MKNITTTITLLLFIFITPIINNKTYSQSINDFDFPAYHQCNAYMFRQIGNFTFFDRASAISSNSEMRVVGFNGNVKIYSNFTMN